LRYRRFFAGLGGDVLSHREGVTAVSPLLILLFFLLLFLILILLACVVSELIKIRRTLQSPGGALRSSTGHGAVVESAAQERTSRPGS
jgi:hypothetical protein